MKTLKALVPVLCLLVAGISAGDTLAYDMSEIARSVVREYVGTFRWSGDDLPQSVGFSFTSVAPSKDRTLEVTGKGRYEVQGRITTIDVRMVVSPRDRGLQIFEANPDRPGFVTDGFHRGHLDSDLRTIEASWYGRDTGESGILLLRSR